MRPARAEPIAYRWVATRRATPLLLNAEGTDLRWMPKGTTLRVSATAKSARVHAWCPAFHTFGSVEAAAVEDVAAPLETEILAQRIAPILPPVISPGELPGRVVGSGRLRSWPEARPDTMVRTLGHNVELQLVELVQGEDGEPWYRVADDVAGPDRPLGQAHFIHSSFVRAPRTDFHPTPRNPDRMPYRWFEADLQQPALLTAYEDLRPVWSSLTLHGRQSDGTPRGDHRIFARVARETMSSERVFPPIPRNAPGGYHHENVLYTQYFNINGAAIHYNYWSSLWGYAGTHGCLGLPLAESRWCWEWARSGTPIRVFA